MSTSNQGPTHRVLEEIPAGILPLALGMMGLGIGVGGWLDPLRFLRYIDIPFTMMLFAFTVWIALRAKKRAGMALVGVILGLVGCLSALVPLLIDREHPLLT